MTMVLQNDSSDRASPTGVGGLARFSDRADGHIENFEKKFPIWKSIESYNASVRFVVMVLRNDR